MTERLILDVENSPVESGGRVRVNRDIFEGFEFSEGEMVVVSSKTKDILVSIYCDEMMENGKISIRLKDRKKLDVDEGDEVEVRKHQKLLQKLL